MSYKVSFQIWEDPSSSPLLIEELSVDGDAALKLYSQFLRETTGSNIAPKTLAELTSKKECMEAESVESTLKIDKKERPISNGKRWTNREKSLICRYSDPKQAISDYMAAYPETERSESSISSMWYKLKNDGLIQAFRLDQYVTLNNHNLPQHGQKGRIIQIKSNEALVRFENSTLWCLGSCLEVTDSPTKN